MIQVYAPASIANMGVGFDVLGMALEPIDGSILGDIIEIEDSDDFFLKNEGLFHDQLPILLERNIIFQCWKRFCEVLQKQYPLKIKLQKCIPVSSGLGSSACSIVSALVAMNGYYNYPLDNNRLLILMGEMEGRISGAIHFDNVSPCFLGGIRLILPGNRGITGMIPAFDNWVWVVAYPGVKISTALSRSVLPDQYSREDCINHAQYLSGFIHACHTQQEDLAISCIQDIIAEPYRSNLLPVDFFYMRSVLVEKGALACGISGSGPTIFVLCNNQTVVREVSSWLSSFYLKNDSGFVKACVLNKLGVRIVTE